MSCFLLPKGLCEDLEQMMRNFWWGQKNQEAKQAWVGWKKMCKSKLQGGMGFRNLKAFNLAMLAKQGWRLLSNPSSLVARLFRAKYHPTGDLLSAKLGSSPSFTWRSIYNSLEVIRRGTRWRVGNGRKIHIWEDKWLPTPTTYRVCSPQRDIDDFPMVSSLIDEDTKRWKADRVWALFYPFEAENILKIPLNYSLPNDSLIWLGNKRGVFTVKSAYYVALPLVEEPSLGECSAGDFRTPLWRKMWHLKLPAKVRIFAWRACVNGLPTRMNMMTRGIDVTANCPICGKEGESTKHAILYCKKICDVWWCWQSCPINLLIETNDIVNVALRIMEAGTCHDLEIFFVTAWSIWYNRNQVAHGVPGSSSVHIWGAAQRALNDYNVAFAINLSRLQAPEVGWSAPPSGLHKINVDGATSEDGKPSAVGVVIRDYRGMVVAACAEILPAQYNVEVTEALAVEKGILLARQKMISHVILESDSLSVVEAISSNTTQGELLPIIQGILLLSSSFDTWKIKHLKREYNKVADELAKMARETGMSQSWFETEPPLLHYLCQIDRANC